MKSIRIPLSVQATIGLVAAAFAIMHGEAPTMDAERPVGYARDVRPILSDRCYKCHGPDAAQRKAGLRLDTPQGATAVLPSGRRAVIPGDTSASALLARVSHHDVAERMPPIDSGRKPVTAAEIDVLKRWIAEGAPFEAHWAFVPPRRPAPPVVADSAWAHSSIDVFIRAEHERRGMTPSAPSGAETLCRKITLDLTGLPPSPDEVQAFAADTKPGAVGRLIDRLFASPRYGEQMARHWLDAARYGDTHGLHLDNERSIWPYRDWVTQAFNRNLPYDRFVTEQLAGDLLPEATLQQRIATGFNRCNVTSAEGGMIASEYLALYAKDRVDTTATVFLGLTLECAKCHDHKFDPFSQKEYYQLYAFFHSISEDASDKNALIAPPFVSAPTMDQKARINQLDADISKGEAELATPSPEIDAAQATWEEETGKQIAGGWVILRPAEAYSAGKATMTIGKDRVVHVTGKSPPRDIYEVVARTHLRDIRVVRVELLPDPDQPGGGIGRADHNNIVLTNVELDAAPAQNCEQTTKIKIDAAAADWNQRDFPAANTLDGKPETGWAISGGADDERSIVFRLEKPISYVGGTQLKLRLGFGSGFLQHTIARFRVSVSDRVDKTPAVLRPWLRTEQPFEGKNMNQALKRAYAPEKNPDPAARYQDGKVGWVPAPEYVDGKSHLFSQLPNRAYYLQRIIDSPSARPFSFFVGSDDSIKVFLNGKEIFVRNVARGVAADQDRVDVGLQAGENRLMIKIVNGGGACGFYFRALGEYVDGVPTAVARILSVAVAQRSDAETTRLRSYYRTNHSEPWRKKKQALRKFKDERKKVEAAYPKTMVMAELPKPRESRILIRGEYDNPGEVVTPGVPSALPPLKDGAKSGRLSLARWLVDPAHPLTSRVFVNRLWQMLFGAGLVATPEDFGSQGTYPTHPQLLDWLAVEFVESGWDIQHMLRLMVSSATYAQASSISAAGLQADPANKLLARGPRHRLDAEEIRDGALLMGGLLVQAIGGKGVRPYQPLGVWKAVGYTDSNTANFRQDKGHALWRRSLYTFWKRTAPHPTMSLLDAPSREACSVRRGRTNTPLQALALMNDIQFVEAARGFGAQALAHGGDDDDARLARMWRWATSRRPDAYELGVMRDLLTAERKHYATRAVEAKRLIETGQSKPPADIDAGELAAWTSIANMILNLDETLTKG
ncbi:MAG: DUF1553 domain-containing protein [Planctomycetes bacterium]|nr:DUF1553 domain-containing protein [Planctomycetota bacterium]